jgi:hypothetical protein
MKNHTKVLCEKLVPGQVFLGALLKTRSGEVPVRKSPPDTDKPFWIDAAYLAEVDDTSIGEAD